MLYSTFTAYLGFAVNEGEYKVMGLASYGRPTLIDEVRRLIRRTPDGAFALDLDYFDFHTTAQRSYSSRFIDLFGPPRSPYEPIDLDTPRAGALPTAPPACSGFSKTCWWTSPARCAGKRACPICAWAAGWR